MLQHTLHRTWAFALGTAVCGSALLGACGSSKGTESSSSKGTTSSSGTGIGTGGAGGGSGLGGSFAVGAGGSSQVFEVSPTALQTISVAPGATMPTVTFAATLNGAPTQVSWSVDRANLGTIGTTPPTALAAATFVPTGTTGGLVNVSATRNGKTLVRQVFIKLTAPAQNGANTGNAAEQGQIAGSGAQLTAGGGIGGVGGTGLGPAYPSFPTTTMPAAMGLALVYPYDKTVWPRGMLAPLLQWNWTPADADAVQIALTTTSGSFSWTGTFGRPPQAILNGTVSPKAPAGTLGTFINHPIPQDVWTMATNTAGGVVPGGGADQLTVSVRVAKGGVAYGPLTETWTIAPGALTGTVYYNSYGTGLVKNSNGLDADQVQYGAAVLGIQAGALAPVVVAGPPGSTAGEGCRVCHVVSADGSQLIAQHGDNYAVTSTYDLKNANAETVETSYPSTFGWAGLYPDGSLALTNTAQLAAGQPAASQLYAFPPAATGAVPLSVTGIPTDLQAGAPAFSGDGKHISFEFLGGAIGAVTGSFTGPSQLVVLDFDKATLSFSNLRTLATAPGGGNQSGGGQNAGLPAFFPTNDAVAYHLQLANPSASHRYNTWQGAQAQVWWSDLATGTAANLSTLNGLNGTTSYLPTNANHPDDTTLNYEPTTAPEASGGYAWVMFTSRRMYGNVATGDPTLSDPRGYDNQAYANVTCKKLWVAAVDIGSIKNGTFMQGWTPGSDPSHPAFYLPAQELIAGNARGFWVLDPCRAEGASCLTGDQCCNGYCEPNGPNGALICGPPAAGCSGLQEKCTTAADCCDSGAICVNGFCAQGSTIN